MKLILLLLCITLTSCASPANYQQLFDDYAYAIDQKVANGQMSAYDGENLKIQYMNQLNAHSSQSYAHRQRALSNLSNSFHEMGSRHSSQCVTEEDVFGKFVTKCY